MDWTIAKRRGALRLDASGDGGREGRETVWPLVQGIDTGQVGLGLFMEEYLRRLYWCTTLLAHRAAETRRSGPAFPKFSPAPVIASKVLSRWRDAHPQ